MQVIPNSIYDAFIKHTAWWKEAVHTQNINTVSVECERSVIYLLKGYLVHISGSTAKK
jgi:hypothetical protein